MTDQRFDDTPELPSFALFGRVLAQLGRKVLPWNGTEIIVMLLTLVGCTALGIGISYIEGWPWWGPLCVLLPLGYVARMAKFRYITPL